MLNLMSGGHPLTVLARCLLQMLVRNQRSKAARLALLIYEADNFLLVSRNKLRESTFDEHKQQ